MTEEEWYDIAIIGGGLAGLCLSIQAADAGYKVILFEKEKYPFHKVCGEYISNESQNFLQRLGFSFDNFQIPFINKLQVSDTKGKLYEFNLPLGGFGISRYTLDNELYKIALQKNVTVLTQCKVSDMKFSDEQIFLLTPAGNFSAKTVAGSFGKRSNLDVKWNRAFIQKKANKLNNYIGIKYHLQFPHEKNVIALHNFKNGYCGISKIEDDKSCLCYLTTADNLKNNNNSIQQMEENVLYQNPHLKKIFTEAKFLYNEPLVISQISFEQKTQVENHVLMLGDAAGMITPLCGNGMSMAMHASKIAFENINDFLHENIARKKIEETYEIEWQQAFRRRLAAGRLIQIFFGGTNSTSFFLKMLNQFPAISKKIIRLTHGNSF